MMFIEALDYSISVEQFGTETANFFAEHPVYGTVGYPTYEDALHDTHGILGIGQFLDSVDSLIEMGLVGDHYVFNAENMIAEIVNECEGWDWTPETGIVPWESSEPELDHSIRPNRKQRRAARRVQNTRHKQSDRAHGKCHGDKYLNNLPRKKYLEADNYNHPTFRVEKGKLRPIHDVKRARETARFHDALDVSEIERLTASVLAEVKQYHGMVGCTWNVFYLSEAICRREQLPYPDSVCVREQGDSVQMILEYFDSYDDEYSTYEYISLR